MVRALVYDAIDGEREYQDGKWGGPGHDAGHGVGSFIVFMDEYLRRAKEKLTTVVGDEAALHELRKVAALAVACFEQHGCPSR
jgi:hypothetical protein